MKIKEKKTNCGIGVTINTGDFENIRIHCEKEVVYSDATPEEEEEMHKKLFKECMEDIVKQGNYALKKLNRNAISAFPDVKVNKNKEESNEQ